MKPGNGRKTYDVVKEIKPKYHHENNRLLGGGFTKTASPAVLNGDTQNSRTISSRRKATPVRDWETCRR